MSIYKIKPIVIALPTDTKYEEKCIYLYNGETLNDFADKCFVSPYDSIKHKSIVRISVPGFKGSVIYREAYSSMRDFHYGYPGSHEIGLIKSDIIDHGYNVLTNKNVVIQWSNGWMYRLMYYWKNPLYAIRIAMKLGLLSVVLSIISIVISFLQ